MFVLSCVMPFTTFWIFLRKKLGHLPKKHYNGDDERCMREILDMEETLFKCDGKGMRWSTVQLYRNLIVVMLDTFVVNPVIKTLCFLVSFVGFFIHDGYRTPFKHPYLNQLQRLTSLALFLITICCNPASFSTVGNILAVPTMDVFLTVLRYFEKSLYIIVPMSLPVWKLWMRYKDRVFPHKDD